ncbi:hypothetical protein JW898_04955 [Candidatus Woesearchaeota archaeon]|nr:hypothetical protein [Candidatus Woesearchaeota archaeon]
MGIFDMIARKLFRIGEPENLEGKVPEGGGPYRSVQQEADRECSYRGLTEVEARIVLMGQMKKEESRGNYLLAGTVAEELGLHDDAVRLYRIAGKECDGSDRYFARARLAHFEGDEKKEKELAEIGAELWGLEGGDLRRKKEYD